jgi:hypothetical protein
MIQLKMPPDDNGGTVSKSTIDYCLKGLIEPLVIARKLFEGEDPKPGIYTLVDNRSRYGYPLTKKGVPSKVRKWIRNEVVLGVFVAAELQ